MLIHGIRCVVCFFLRVPCGPVQQGVPKKKKKKKKKSKKKKKGAGETIQSAQSLCQCAQHGNPMSTTWGPDGKP